MPLELRPVAPENCLSWMRVRSTAYYGPTHDVLHTGPIRESSIRGVAQDRARDLKKSNKWHWMVVDTDLEPSEDDPVDLGGRVIAVSAWTMVTSKPTSTSISVQDGSKEESSAIPAETHPEQQNPKETDPPPFLPPELRLDALNSLFGPLRTAQEEIMSSFSTYFMLNTLATHPSHTGRGAAKLLLNWGLEKADREGLTTYLDATEVAWEIYERRGFKVERRVEWDRKEWGGEGRDRFWCMVRRPGEKGE